MRNTGRRMVFWNSGCGCRKPDTHAEDRPDKGAESGEQEPLMGSWREKSPEWILRGDKIVVRWAHFMWTLLSNCIF